MTLNRKQVEDFEAARRGIRPIRAEYGISVLGACLIDGRVGVIWRFTATPRVLHASVVCQNGNRFRFRIGREWISFPAEKKRAKRISKNPNL